MLLKQISKALKRGESLQNAEGWARAASLGSQLSTLVVSAVALMRALGVEIVIDKEVMTEAALALGALWLWASDIIHTAANKEAGHG